MHKRRQLQELNPITSTTKNKTVNEMRIRKALFLNYVNIRAHIVQSLKPQT